MMVSWGAKIMSPTQLHHQQQPETLNQGGLDPCFHAVHAKFGLAIQTNTYKLRIRQCFSNLLLTDLVHLCELQLQFPALS